MSSTTAAWRSEANLSRVIRRRDLTIDHEAEPLLKGERRNIGLALLVIERLGHASESQRGEAFEGVVSEHAVSFLPASFFDQWK
jgi:hypothetical protein